MKTIGLTGGIGSGKSTVANILKKVGVPIFDADKEAHNLFIKNSITYKKLLDKFTDELGYDILTETGNIDRKKLGEIVFSNRDLLTFLENITHNQIKANMEQFAIDCCKEKHKVIVFDIPLLIEKKWCDLFDYIWLVYVPRQVQEERLLIRDRFYDKNLAIKKIEAQIPIEEKKRFADFIIDNTRSIDFTEKTVLDEWNRIIELEDLDD